MSDFDELQREYDELVRRNVELKQKFKSCGLGRREVNALMCADVRTLEQIALMSDLQLLSIPHIGLKSLRNIRQAGARLLETERP